MKDFITRIKKFKLLLLILILLFEVSLYSGLTLQGRVGDFLINISAGIITIVGTLFVVDILIEKRKKEESKEIFYNAKEELIYLTRVLIGFIEGALRFEDSLDMSREISSKLKETELEKFENLDFTLIKIKYFKKSIKKVLIKAEKEEWERLIENLEGLRPRILECISLYEKILPGNIFGNLLSVKRLYDDLSSFINISKPLLVTDKKIIITLREKKLEKNYKETKKKFVSIIEKKIRQYFLKTEELRNSLDKWNN